MVQQFSFEFGYPKIKFHGIEFSVSIHTFENTYTVDPADWTEKDISPKEREIVGTRLRFAGGQLSCNGRYKIRMRVKENGAVGISFQIKMDLSIRGTRLILYEQPNGQIISRIDASALPVPKTGVTLSYPEAWRCLATPFLAVQNERGYSWYRSLDKAVNAKRFTLYGEDKLTVELSYDTLGINVGCFCITPEWEIGFAKELDAVYQEHTWHMAEAYDLEPWEVRKDVPDWLRNISLVVALHGMHFTGYIFNTYSDMLEKLEWLAEQIDPAKVLVYLPGFEGRYYWEYGKYDASQRLGGIGQLKRLVTRAKEMGFHIFPMLGANIVNTKTENFVCFGDASRFVTAGGVYPTNMVDWDNSRTYDHGWMACLNPAAPAWQNRLLDEAAYLYHEFGFSGIYLDISGMWFNDARYDVAEGTRTLVRRIRERCEDCLVIGEAWYDGIANVFPLVQNGHTDGVMHYYDEAIPGLFETYCRMFGHLCQGDPGSNSTGVHELGYNSITSTPMRRAIIPTLTMVGDTLDKNMEGVKEIVKQAETYYKLYIAETR